MSSPIYLTLDQLPCTLRNGYAGRRITAYIQSTVDVPATAGMWDGGTRDTYRVIRLADGQQMPLDKRPIMGVSLRPDRKITLEPGIVVTRTTEGSYSALAVYLRPEDAAPLLPAPAPALGPYEQLVLLASRDRKSSYNGKDRFQMMRDDLQYGGATTRVTFGLEPLQPIPDRTAWDATTITLQGRGLLAKNRSITPAGRNAIAHVRGI